MSREQRNRLAYIGLFAANVTAGWAMTEIAAGSFPWFADPANAPYKTLALAQLGPAVMGLTTYLAAKRPRWGRAEIAAQVDDVGPRAARNALAVEVQDQATARQLLEHTKT